MLLKLYSPGEKDVGENWHTYTLNNEVYIDLSLFFSIHIHYRKKKKKKMKTTKKKNLFTNVILKILQEQITFPPDNTTYLRWVCTEQTATVKHKDDFKS